MSTRELETGIASLKFARRMMMALLDATPEELWFHVPVPDGNHAAWIAGHVAWEDDDNLRGLVEGRGSKVPQQWHDCFAQRSKPTPNPADYPSISDICAALPRFREELIGYFTASVDRMAEPLPREWNPFAKDRAALMHGIACHEMIHVGQLTVIRKSLKLKPVFA